jgi:hypothetical protein
VEYVFRRRQPLTHGRLARDELTESYEHLRMAAAHAASGAAGALAPRVTAARDAGRTGLKKARGKASESAHAIARTAGKGKAKVTKKETGMTGRRWPMIIGGLLVAGATIGAASALIRRRKAQNKWDEYGATRSTTGGVLESTRSTMDAGVDKVSSIADAAKDRASDLIGSSSSTTTGSTTSGSATTGSASDLSNPSTRDLKQQRDDMYGKPTATTGAPTTASKNSRT